MSWEEIRDEAVAALGGRFAGCTLRSACLVSFLGIMFIILGKLLRLGGWGGGLGLGMSIHCGLWLEKEHMAAGKQRVGLRGLQPSVCTASALFVCMLGMCHLMPCHQAPWRPCPLRDKPTLAGCPSGGGRAGKGPPRLRPCALLQSRRPEPAPRVWGGTAQSSQRGT